MDIWWLGVLAACGDPPPNVVVLLIDDLGWVDTGVYGSAFYETPAIDRLAADGVRFTQFYASSPVCSPTRAAIMTGKHPARLHLTNWIGGEQRGPLLPAEYVRELPAGEVTLGEAFRDAGYVTGYVGKWHLGDGDDLPETQGFDYTVAVNHAGQPGSYFYPYRSVNWPATDVPDLADGSEGEYLTDRLTEEAVRFLETHGDRPFFLVLSHYAVHTPLQAKADLEAKYEVKRGGEREDAAAFAVEGPGYTKQRQDNATYAAMVESTDQSVARILDALDRLGLDDRTIVAFVSDNGGLSTLLRRRPSTPTANLPLRAGKGWLYEGGIRVPFIVRWPDRIVGGRETETPATTADLFPTLLDLAGLAPRPDAHRDGVSLAPLLRSDSAPGSRALFWHFPHYHGSGSTPSAAVRDGDLKLITWFEDDRTELYDLSADPAERRDLSGDRPESVRRLRETWRRWRAEVGARLPRPNPAWTGAR